MSRSKKTWRRGRFEMLEDRRLMAITASFAPTSGILSVVGDQHDNVIEFSRDANGTIRVNNGAVTIKGGVPSVANTTRLVAFGLTGNDTITVNETNGALPRAQLYGGSGHDTLTGGSGGDLMFGQSGNDQLFGRGGADQLFGGADDDVLIGGDGDDQVFGESGNDRMVWAPGDDSDLNEGGSGVDVVEVQGGNGDEKFTATANGLRVRFDRLDSAPFFLDIGSSESLVVNMNNGDDQFSATGNLAALIQITVDGGDGNDTILGSNGNDVLIGGDGNDFVDGQQGNDVALLGMGDDIFQWDPGDGSDTIEGQGGHDTLTFNGSNASEIFEFTANGDRLRMTRNVGNIVMDTNDVERVHLQVLGGADVTTVNDLSSTDVVEVRVHLAGVLGGTSGDAQADTVVVFGSDQADSIDVFSIPSGLSVLGLPTLVHVVTAEAVNDSLVVNAGGGDDTVSAATLAAGLIRLTLDGGTGDDELRGSMGADVLLGGDGDDLVFGNQGNDVALLGAGNDTFLWSPGHGNDIIEGQAGADQLIVNGSNASEVFNVLANGSRGIVLRDVSSMTLDFDDVETLDLRVFGGGDSIIFGDLSATDLTQVHLDLSGGSTSTDGQADSVIVSGTNADDSIGILASASGITVNGIGTVDIKGIDGDLDRLTVNALGGADLVDASGVGAGIINLTFNGGLGNDLLVGSQGDDQFNGGDGDDLILMGDGDDQANWNPGDDNDTVEGQGGNDRLIFNGSNASENVSISANGQRVRFFRDVANVTLDLDDVEAIDLRAAGGADIIVVNDLTGTDLSEINLDLGVAGVGDAQPDDVIVHGTQGDDAVLVLGGPDGVTVIGLQAQINIVDSEAANDRLIVNLHGGDDVLDAVSLAANVIRLTGDGGSGNDVLIGSDAADILFGGDGDDVLIGGPGLDILDGGPGDDIEIQ